MYKQDWTYYHALYHLIAHWAALVAVVGLLTTTGVVISTAAGPMNGIERSYCRVAILGMLGGSLFFTWRMVTYSTMVKQMLAGTFDFQRYEERLSRVGAQNLYFTIISVAAALFLTGFVWAIVSRHP